MEEDIRRNNEERSLRERGNVRFVRVLGGGGGLGPFLVLGGALVAAAFTSRVLQRRGLNASSGGATQTDGESIQEKDVPGDFAAVEERTNENDGEAPVGRMTDEDGGVGREATVEGSIGSDGRNAAVSEHEGRAAEIEAHQSSRERESLYPPLQSFVSEQQPLLPAPPQPALLPSLAQVPLLTAPPILPALPAPSTTAEDSPRQEHLLDESSSMSAEPDSLSSASSPAGSQRQSSFSEENQFANQAEEPAEPEEEQQVEEQSRGEPASQDAEEAKQEELPPEEDQSGGAADGVSDDVTFSEEQRSTQLSDSTTVESSDSSLESSTEPIWPAEAATESSSTASLSRPSTPEEEQGMKHSNDPFQAVDGRNMTLVEGRKFWDKRRQPLAGESGKGLVVVPASGMSNKGFIQLAMTMAAVMAFLALVRHHSDIAAAFRRLYTELFTSRSG